MEILPVIAITAQSQVHSEASKYLTGIPLMEKTTSVQCHYERDRSIRFFKHRKGFTAYTLDHGIHTVFMLNVDEQVENTSIKLARELVFELRDTPPLSQSLTADSWVNSALYKFGGPDLQFESQTFSGTIEISEMKDNGDCHGLIHLKFTNPAIDRVGLNQADLDISF